MSDNDEHRELVAVWKSLNGIMDGLRQRLRGAAPSMWMSRTWPTECADYRSHLDSAVELANQFCYEPALALLRP
jgi:hypothetical protein